MSAKNWFYKYFLSYQSYDLVKTLHKIQTYKSNYQCHRICLLQLNQKLIVQSHSRHHHSHYNQSWDKSSNQAVWNARSPSNLRHHRSFCKELLGCLAWVLQCFDSNCQIFPLSFYNRCKVIMRLAWNIAQEKILASDNGVKIS